MHNLQNACFDDRPALNVKLKSLKPPRAIQFDDAPSADPHSWLAGCERDTK